MAHRNVFALLVVAWCLGAANDTWATNTAFLPGDAFFHTTLSVERIGSLADEESPTFRYVRPQHVFSNGCGYAGFWDLKYVQIPPALRENLILIGRHIHRTETAPVYRRDENPQTGEVRESQLNSPHLFIYNNDFKETVGLKFNEDWVKHTARYEPFITDYRFVARDWQHAPRIEGLKVELPFALDGGKKPDPDRKTGGFFGQETAIPMGGPAIDEAVIVRGPMKLIVVPRTGVIGGTTARELHDIALDRRNALMYVVTVDGVIGRRIERSDWVDFDPFADENETDSDQQPE